MAAAITVSVAAATCASFHWPVWAMLLGLVASLTGGRSLKDVFRSYVCLAAGIAIGTAATLTIGELSPIIGPLAYAPVVFAVAKNCRVRSCNHTFGADSFEKRDDFCIARKFSDECFHLIRHERVGFRRRAFDILSGTPDPDSQSFLSKLSRAMLELEFGISLTLWRMPRSAWT